MTEKTNEVYEAACKYVKMGFWLIPLPYGKKSCYVKGWTTGHGNIATISDCNYFLQHPLSNMGVNLGFTDILIIDIDHKPQFVKFCETYGLDDLLRVSTMGIKSPRKNSGKMIFRRPRDWTGTFHKVTQFEDYDGCVVEFRCGMGYQDALPPSLHPEGKKYELVNEAAGIADLPDSVRKFWEDWDNNAYVKSHKKELKYHTPTENREDEYNDLHWLRENLDLKSELITYGAVQKSPDRWISPYSKTKTAGIYLFDDCWFYCHNNSDPNFADGKSHTAFDLWVVNNFGRPPRDLSKTEWRHAFGKAALIRIDKEKWLDDKKIDYLANIRGI